MGQLKKVLSLINNMRFNGIRIIVPTLRAESSSSKTSLDHTIPAAVAIVGVIATAASRLRTT